MGRPAVAVILLGALLSGFVTACAEDVEAIGLVVVEDGQSARVASADGRLVVDLPAGSFTGSGELSVVPTTSGTGLEGWSVNLDGATLTGEAQLRFHTSTIEDGEPPPLVAYSEDGSSELTPVGNVTLDGTVAMVTTSHFSNWFVTWWGDLLDGARARMDRVYAADSAGQQPQCDGEQAVRARGYSVTSDSGSRVMWCLGENSAGAPELVVANARGYAVTIESTPGLELVNEPDGDLVAFAAELIKERPSLPQNTVTLLEAGGELTFALTGEGKNGVQVRPSVSSYLLTALQYGFDTYASTVGRMKDLNKTEKALTGALKAEGCLAGYSSMVTADITTANEASKYLNDAVGTVLGCLEKIIEEEGLSAEAGIAEGFTWFVQGVRTAANGIGAAADTALNPQGYTIVITAPTQPTNPSPGPNEGVFASRSGVVCDISRPGPEGQPSATCWVPDPAYSGVTVVGEVTCDETMRFEAPLDTEFNFSCEHADPPPASVLGMGEEVTLNGYTCTAEDGITCVFDYSLEESLVFRISKDSFELYFESSTGRIPITSLGTD